MERNGETLQNVQQQQKDNREGWELDKTAGEQVRKSTKGWAQS